MSGAPQPKPTLADRLREVRVGVRPDLDVTRHLFRGEVSYVISDPVTFQNHRLDQHGYDVFVAIKSDRCLGEILADLTARGVVSDDDAESFYEFVFSLHRQGFLALPISDDKALYRRFTAKRDARRRRRILSLLFLRIPVWNPDAFLTRTVKYANPFFSRTAFALWIALVLAASYVAFQNRAELGQPLDGLLAAGNLAAMWFMLIGLKVLHEFGHAYACKRYGGHVPDMGVYLILGTPCAYVDATASWSFARRFQRLAVCLAGMYVESAAAAVAVFVWAFTDAPFLRSIAYNVMFLASVTTILFNINPLMRYDGYYVLSDLLEVPNLRQRAAGFVQSMAKRFFLGIRMDDEPVPARLGIILFAFGIASTLYRTALMLAIASAVAVKLFFVGIAGAAAYIIASLGGALLKTLKYLWFAAETAPVRVRAVAVSILLVAGLPAVIIGVPVPNGVIAAGVVHWQRETTVRADVSGFLEDVPPHAGEFVSAGVSLGRLRSDEQIEALADATARVAESRIRRDALAVASPSDAAIEARRLLDYESELAHHQREQAALEIIAPHAGRIVESLPPTAVGRYVPEGEAILMLADGGWEVRVVLTAEEVATAEPQLGDSVRFRGASARHREIAGLVTRIRPAGTEHIEETALTHHGGGSIPVDPTTGAAGAVYFEVTVRLEDAGDAVCRGMTGHVRFAAAPEPIGIQIYRRVVRFADRLQRG